MKKKYDLKVFKVENHDTEPALLIVFDSSVGVDLTLIVAQNVYSASDTFPFVALQKIRRVLEESGELLCCAGGRIDVHPSGRMLVGFNAYKLIKGQPVKKGSVVSIFKVEDDILALGTVQEQDDFYAEWLESLNPNS